MKKYIIVGLLILFCSIGAFAQMFDFTLINQTGRDIFDVYVSPSEDDEWYDSWFADDYILYDGDEAYMEFDEDYELDLYIYGTELFDMLVVDENGDEFMFTELMLENISKIVLTMDDGGTMRATWR